MKLSHIAMGLALAGSFAGLAHAAAGTGSISHDIQFGGVIAENAPQWKWSLPQQTIRIDLKDGDGVVVNSTKTWDVMQNRQPYRFLEGYMTATIPNMALTGLNPKVTYLQNSVEVTPEAGANNQTVLNLKAVGNNGSTPVDGTLKLTLSPVLLLGQAAKAGDTTLVVKSLSGPSVTAPDTNAPQALVNATAQLDTQKGSLNATGTSYDASSTWPKDMLADNTTLAVPAVGGYASTVNEAELRFPSDSPVSTWQSVITVQVQYI